MDAIWSFETAQFRVALTAEPEDMDPADSFEFAEHIAFAREDDPAHWFVAVVTVTHKATGLKLGRVTLCGCSYRSFDEFVSGHRDPNPEYRNTLAMKAQNRAICHYFPGMVAEACEEARATARKLCGSLRWLEPLLRT